MLKIDATYFKKAIEFYNDLKQLKVRVGIVIFILLQESLQYYQKYNNIIESMELMGLYNSFRFIDPYAAFYHQQLKNSIFDDTLLQKNYEWINLNEILHANRQK